MIARLLAPLLGIALLVSPVAAKAASRRDMVTSFDRVRIQGAYDVRLVTGSGATAVIEADPRLIDAISIDVQGTTLTVSTGSFDSHVAVPAGAALPVITLTTPALRGATVNAGGRLRVTGMTAQRLDLYVGGSGSLSVIGTQADELIATLMGSGSITLTGRALRARLSASGPGAIDASALATNDLTVRLDGPGEIKAAARSTANVTTLGTGAVTVSGSPSCTISRTAGGPVVCGK